VELGVGKKHSDLVSEGIDCAIRPGEVSEQMMVTRRIGEFHFITCATPDFLARHGTPRTPAELSTRPSVGMIYARSGRALPFQFSDGSTHTEPALSHRLVVNDTNSYLAAGLAGLGIKGARRFVPRRERSLRSIPARQERCQGAAAI
jgi:DNA-binding transcriptional LysR family regulator